MVSEIEPYYCELSLIIFYKLNRAIFGEIILNHSLNYHDDGCD